MKLTKTIKLTAISLTVLAINIASSKQATETISCTWPNGDHWSIITNDYDYGSQLIERCVRDGGTPGFSDI